LAVLRREVLRFAVLPPPPLLREREVLLLARAPPLLAREVLPFAWELLLLLAREAPLFAREPLPLAPELLLLFARELLLFARELLPLLAREVLPFAREPLWDREEEAFFALDERRREAACSRSSPSALTSFFDSDFSSSVRNFDHSLCSSRRRLASLAVPLSSDALASARRVV
jgi:hypothetical protein